MASHSHRRDFLVGKSAADAARDLVDRIAGDEVPLPAPSAVAEPTLLVHYARPAMGTRFEVYLNAGQHSGDGAAALAALDRIDELEAQFSIYRDDSEVSQLNRTAHEAPVVVEEGLFDLLALAQSLRQETGGAIDITAGPLTKAWGFFQRQGAVPNDADLQAALSRVGGEFLRLNEVDQTVELLRPGMEINLGAIGKGYALDRVAAEMRAAGIADFMLHGGQSSVLAAGSRGGTPDGGWIVGIQHPLRPEQRLAEVRLADAALGTSADTHQHLRHRGRRLGHILDPRTGWPAEGVLQTTVRAPRAAVADALSTAFYVLGWEAAAAYCEQHTAVAALLVLPGQKSGEIRIASIGFTPGELSISSKASP